MASTSSPLSDAREPSQAGGSNWLRQLVSSPPLAFPTLPDKRRSPTDLAQVIEGEIIPRLMLAHRAAAKGTGATGERQPIGPRTLSAFVRMTVSNEVDALVGFIEALLQGGASLEDVYVDLLRPTAQRLGAAWDEDAVSFTDVTIGLGRLQQVVRTFGWKLPPSDVADGAGAVCFGLCPDEQHTFGLFMLEDAFRRGGWTTWMDGSRSQRESAAAVHCDWFDVFGLSASCDTSEARVCETIQRIRDASCNRDLFVLVGGRLFADDPELFARVGADATAESGREALIVADKALRRQVLG